MATRKRIVLKVILAVIVVLGAAAGFHFYRACQSRPTEIPRTGPLEKRVGGRAGLEELAHAFVGSLLEDDRLAHRFSATNRAQLETRLTSFLCKSVGGGCTYEGKGMAEAHGSLSITAEEFAAFMELFIVAMNDVELPQQEQNDLIDVMMAMEDSIVKK
jgi:hemoglobin